MRWLAVGLLVLMVFVGAGYASAVDEMEAVDAEMLLLPPVPANAAEAASAEEPAR